MINREKLAEIRFWSKVNVTFTATCWGWKASKSGTRDYGIFWYHGRNEMAHRVAWKLFNNKDIPKDLEVCHKCDNPICCNPFHLFLGTHKENMGDMTKKGRGNRRHGVNHHLAKLSISQVQEIRKQYVPYVLGYRVLAKRFGVTQTAIKSIVCRKSWKDID